ncbi:hypothetical protein ACU4GD_11405 [Cupriavidus basilensis]
MGLATRQEEQNPHMLGSDVQISQGRIHFDQEAVAGTVEKVPDALHELTEFSFE